MRIGGLDGKADRVRTLFKQNRFCLRAIVVKLYIDRMFKGAGC